MEGEGRVIKSTGSSYLVNSPEAGLTECVISGKYRLEGLRSTNPVVVGDQVRFSVREGEKLGRINDVLPRKNYIIRKATKLSKSHQIIAANIDQLILMATVIKPATHAEFIDRYLVTSEAYNIPTILLFNKIDLYGDPEKRKLSEWQRIYEAIGYSCIECSLETKVNLDQIKSALKEKVTLLAGNSGVGKSTLINILEPTLNLKTREISHSHKSGKHTTTFAEMFELGIGGFIIDTPGIRGFGITDMEDEPLYHYFPELFKVSAGCKYHNCIHVNEPECAVLQSVESGNISLSRYKSYLNLLEEQQDNSKYR